MYAVAPKYPRLDQEVEGKSPISLINWCLDASSRSSQCIDFSTL
jgi:hypothetical protein